MSSSTESKKPADSCCEGNLREWYDSAERCARQDPLKASLIAFGVGLILTIFPVGRIVGALVRLVISAIRPILIVIGAMKVMEEFEKRRHP